MTALLLSINPEHVKNIISGKKTYEFRKTQCKRDFKKILIYSTSPVMKIVGEAEVSDILIGSPSDIWTQTKQQSGINKEFFDSYYRKKSQAIAYKLSNVIEYEYPRDLSEYGLKTPPQSFCYIDV